MLTSVEICPQPMYISTPTFPYSSSLLISRAASCSLVNNGQLFLPWCLGQMSAEL